MTMVVLTLMMMVVGDRDYDRGVDTDDGGGG